MALRQWILAGLAVLILGALAAPSVSSLLREPEPVAYTAPGLDPITPQEAGNELFTLIPALLMVVYDAFGQTQEGAIYDTLAVVADGEALETLYLERAGAMVGGGLTEADQTIHEMRLKGAQARPEGDGFTVDATWEVIGTVGHSEHLHVRGNTYRADLAIAPADGAWKITGFTLTDVDRNTAGEMVEADPS